jgi:hypothetical protein
VVIVLVARPELGKGGDRCGSVSLGKKRGCRWEVPCPGGLGQRKGDNRSLTPLGCVATTGDSRLFCYTNIYSLQLGKCASNLV